MDHSRKNILFSTTRQWNPGDEFILMGILNLMGEAGLEFNPIIYNRNPEVRTTLDYMNPLRKLSGCFKGSWILRSFLRIGNYDNSFKEGMSHDFLDMVVFAGTPAWYSSGLYSLYSVISKRGLPVLYIGIGAHEDFSFDDLSSLEKNVLRGSKCIIVRDQRTYNALKNLGAVHLPCPSLFSATQTKEINEVKKIALVFMTDKAVYNHRIPPEMAASLKELYADLIKINRWEIDVVCHYIDELPDACQFKNRIRYSYAAEDYVEIYKNYDLVIGPRVHAIGLAASLGVPGIYFPHDKRWSTVENFNAMVVDDMDKDKIFKQIEYVENNITILSAKLRKVKEESKKQYLPLIRRGFGLNEI